MSKHRRAKWHNLNQRMVDIQRVFPRRNDTKDLSVMTAIPVTSSTRANLCLSSPPKDSIPHIALPFKTKKTTKHKREQSKQKVAAPEGAHQPAGQQMVNTSGKLNVGETTRQQNDLSQKVETGMSSCM